MSITTDKLVAGQKMFTGHIKYAAERAETGVHLTTDVGVLWAADRIATLTAELEAEREKVARLTARGIETLRHENLVLRNAWFRSKDYATRSIDGLPDLPQESEVSDEYKIQ